jgi:hypothetical protein
MWVHLLWGSSLASESGEYADCLEPVGGVCPLLGSGGDMGS